VDCGRCGRANPGHVRYCLDCGSVLQVAEQSAPAAPAAAKAAGDRVNCGVCGVDNPRDASFCRDCGGKLNAPQPSAVPAKKQERSPLAGTLIVQSKPPMPPADVSGTLASAEAIQIPAPDTPQPQAERSRQPEPVRAPVSPRGSAPDPAQHAPAPPEASRGLKTCKACGGQSGAAARFCQLCGLPFDRASGERPRSTPPAVAEENVPDAELVVIAQDGSPGRRYSLAGVRTIIGNGEADISLRKDPYVSPVHAEISYRNGRFQLVDRGSLNGVFVRLGGSVPLTSGDLLLVGLGVLRFEIVEESERNLAPQTRNDTRVFGTPASPRYARLTTQTVEGVARDRYYLARAETVLGREVGDIVFTDDPFMSRRHAAIRRDPNTNKFTIRDLGSSNGTFIALRDEHTLSPGDHVRIGQHLFRLDVRNNG